MHFSICENQFKTLLDELKKSHESATESVVTAVLHGLTEKAKERAERAEKLASLIRDIVESASQV